MVPNVLSQVYVSTDDDLADFTLTLTNSALPLNKSFLFAI